MALNVPVGANRLRIVLERIYKWELEDKPSVAIDAVKDHVEKYKAELFSEPLSEDKINAMRTMGLERTADAMENIAVHSLEFSLPDTDAKLILLGWVGGLRAKAYPLPLVYIHAIRDAIVQWKGPGTNFTAVIAAVTPVRYQDIYNKDPVSLAYVLNIEYTPWIGSVYALLDKIANGAATVVDLYKELNAQTGLPMPIPLRKQDSCAVEAKVLSK